MVLTTYYTKCPKSVILKNLNLLYHLSQICYIQYSKYDEDNKIE